MSTRLLSSPRSRTAAITLATTAVLTGALGGVAAADPPALDRDPCATTIAAAGVWPGTVGEGRHAQRLVSDAFDTYLSRQPECAPELAAR